MKATTTAHLALLGTNIFFAINLTSIKYLVNEGFAKPFAINIIRVGVTAALLWIFFIFKRQKRLVKKTDVGRFFLCALSGVAINQLMFVKGLSLTYSIHASLLMLTTPILIIMISALFLKERLTVTKIIGLCVGITGAVLLITAKENTGNASEVFLGDLLIILNAIAYTFYFVLVKPLMKTYDPIMITRVIFTMGFFMMLPFCWTEFLEIRWHDYTWSAALNLGLVAIAGTFLAYLFNVYGIKILGAGIAGTYIYSQPFFATAIAMIFLNESLTIVKIIAAVFIFFGVYLSNKKSQ